MKVTFENLETIWDGISGKVSDVTKANYDKLKKSFKFYHKSEPIKTSVDKLIVLINDDLENFVEDSDDDYEEVDYEEVKPTRKTPRKFTREQVKSFKRSKKVRNKQKVNKDTYEYWRKKAKPYKAPKVEDDPEEEPTKPPKKSGEKKSGSKKKGDTKKKTDTKKKESKSKKAHVNPLKNWQKTLEKFISMTGKSTDGWRVYQFVCDINTSFTKALGHKTPHVDLITEIRDKMADLCEKGAKQVGRRNVIEIPKWSELVDKCKQAIKNDGDVYDSKKEKDKLKLPTLSGLGNIFRKAFGKKR